VVGGKVRNRQVSRILRILHHLELNTQGLSAREILNKLKAEDHACSRETVYRDLKAIEQAFIPLEIDESQDPARYKLSRVAHVSKDVAFSYLELLALTISRESMRVFDGTTLEEVLTPLFNRLEKLLGLKGEKAMTEFSEYLGFKPRSSYGVKVPREILDTLHQACAEGQILEMDYLAASGERAGQVATRRVGPEMLYFADSGIYLIARDLATTPGQMKTYAVSRVKRAVMLDDAYESDDFNFDHFHKDSLAVLREGDVTSIEIVVREPMASYISERQWHPSQRSVRTSTGVRLTMDVRMNDELVRWILGMGSAAEVVGPSGLRDRVVQELGRMVAAYSRKAS
jgi:predicted DNA-binding transcriptional regulator YafY